ncbi:MAG: T9SS type A sorting domain-containing protein [Candidatus Kapaibacterium sp.]
MKALFLVCALFLVPCFLSAQSFTVAVSPAVQSVAIGQTATYSVSILPMNGFKATAFLSVSPSRSFSGTLVLSTTSPNAPYANITLKITPTIQDTGTFTFTVKAENSGTAATATCALSVAKNAQWTTLKCPAVNGIYPILNEYSFVTKDKAGDICMAYQNEKTVTLYHYRNRHWETDTLAIVFPQNQYSIYYYMFGKNDDIWFSIRKGIANFDGKFLTTYYTSNSGLKTDGLIAGMDKNGTPFGFAYNEDGQGKNYFLSRFDGSDWKSTALTLGKNIHGRSDSLTNQWCIDSTNRLWIPSSESGIVRIQDTTVERILSKDSTIISDYVQKVVCDKNGGIWCMYQAWNSESMILSHFDGGTWKHIKAPKTNLKYETNNTFLVDNDLHVWLSTESGLHFYNGTDWTSYNKTNSPLPSGTRTLLQDKNKNIWMVIGNLFYIFNPNGLVDIPLAPTAVEEESILLQNGISISPNPTSTTFTISGIDDISSVKILNSLGIEVSRKSLVVRGKLEVDVSDLAAGVYFVQVWTPAGIISKAVVVAR